MASERDKILQRITNLRARAEDDASSENEAIAAATKAAKLMEAYNVAEAELALAETEGRVVIEIVHQKVNSAAGKQKHRAVACATSIAHLTNTKPISLDRSRVVEFTGHKPDVEMATYLFELVRDAMDREYENYRLKMGPGIGRGAKASFQIGMATRINSRLRAMASEIKSKREKRAEEAKRIEQNDLSSSTALVLVDAQEEKERMTETKFKERYPQTVSSRSSYRTSNVSAYSAGSSAGNRVGFGRPVGDNGTKRIEA